MQPRLADCRVSSCLYIIVYIVWGLQRSASKAHLDLRCESIRAGAAAAATRARSRWSLVLLVVRFTRIVLVFAIVFAIVIVQCICSSFLFFKLIEQSPQLSCILIKTSHHVPGTWLLEMFGLQEADLCGICLQKFRISLLVPLATGLHLSPALFGVLLLKFLQHRLIVALVGWQPILLRREVRFAIIVLVIALAFAIVIVQCIYLTRRLRFRFCGLDCLQIQTLPGLPCASARWACEIVKGTTKDAR